MPTLKEIYAELDRMAAELDIVSVDFGKRAPSRQEKALVEKVHNLNDAVVTLQHSFQRDDLGKVLMQAEEDSLLEFGIW